MAIQSDILHLVPMNILVNINIIIVIDSTNGFCITHIRHLHIVMDACCNPTVTVILGTWIIK